MRKLIVIAVCGLVAVVVAGFMVSPPECKKNCDQRPAYWYHVPIPYSSYMSAYHVSRSGVPVEEESHTSPSAPHEESHPVSEPHVAEPHVSVAHGVR